jgi:predicted nucleic acid-binding protein
MIVIADTSPFNYLIQIGQINILESLFVRVLIPRAVCEELSQPYTPEPVRSWIAHPPAWLEIRASRGISDPRLSRLRPGEREAILLAEELGADRLLLDDLVPRPLKQLELLMKDIGGVQAGECPVDLESMAIHGTVPSGTFSA